MEMYILVKYRKQQLLLAMIKVYNVNGSYDAVSNINVGHAATIQIFQRLQLRL